MNCVEAKHILMDIALDETTPDQQPDLRSHLETCAACRAELADFSLSRKLLNDGLPMEEVPRRIAFAAPAPAAKPAWSLWRPFALPVAVAAMVVMMVGALAVARTSITVDQGRWSVAFGVAPAITVYRPASPAPQPATGQALFSRQQVESLVAAAVRDSEARQLAETTRLISAASNRIEQRHYFALSALAEQIQGVRIAQTNLYRDSERSRVEWQTIASRFPIEKGERQ